MTQPSPKSDPRARTVKVTILRKRVPRLPHERDESAVAQASAPGERMRQASDDLARGLQVTDRGREMDRLRRQLKVRV